MVHRRYVHRRTGQAVDLLLVCGRAGPTSVHTPDVCYRGSGYDEVGEATRYAAPGGGAFWVRRFQKPGPAPAPLRVIYGWNATGAWEAPDSPRTAFAGRAALYKLYVIREMARTDEPLEEDPAVDFLRAALPPLGAALFPAP
jgi:hypothetical protein